MIIKKEYIEREAARNIFTPPLRDPESLDFWEWLQSEIDAIPAADVRPVVLCRDCKYYYKDTDGYEMCDNSEGYDHVTEDGFCAWAVKMEES